jgi:hypothetical protein
MVIEKRKRNITHYTSTYTFSLSVLLIRRMNESHTYQNSSHDTHYFT